MIDYLCIARKYGGADHLAIVSAGPAAVQERAETPQDQIRPACLLFELKTGSACIGLATCYTLSTSWGKEGYRF